jgi:hypothetical protein
MFLVAPNLKIEIPVGNQSVHLYARLCGIAGLFATSLVASNAALARLDVSSVQMIKALNPAVIYALGVILQIEKSSWSVLASLTVICGGVIYAVQGVLKFQAAGFFLQLIAILADGARHLYLQATLQSCIGGLDPINILNMIAPIAAVFLWAIGSMSEFPAMRLVLRDLQSMLPLVLASSLLAFTLNLCSYAYIKATSALSMSVSGILKDVFMIGTSVAYLGSEFNWQQCLGYVIAIGGTVAYTIFRDARAEETDAQKHGTIDQVCPATSVQNR